MILTKKFQLFMISTQKSYYSLKQLQNLNVTKKLAKTNEIRKEAINQYKGTQIKEKK